jgi:hypothetical protein
LLALALGCSLNAIKGSTFISNIADLKLRTGIIFSKDGYVEEQHLNHETGLLCKADVLPVSQLTISWLRLHLAIQVSHLWFISLTLWVAQNPN